MSDTELPETFDVIILGTGITESILAAALARIGKSVLHLDRNDYYSGEWVSFDWRSMQQWVERRGISSVECSGDSASKQLTDSEKLVPLSLSSSSISNIVLTNNFQPSTECPSATQKAPGLPLSDHTAEPEHAHTTESLSEATPCCSSDDPDDQTNTDPKSASEEIENKIDDSKDKQSSEEWTTERAEKQWRKFSFDIMPKLIYCNGPMVALLISSNTARYCEFRIVSKLLTFRDNELQPVPCSRADVFNSKQVSMVDKRILMKFLTFCMEHEKHTGEYDDNMTFSEFLSSKQLSDNLKHYVQHAIAMVPVTASVQDGLKSSQLFLSSLGRYGNSAFLWPLFGSGELSQCFCRMCAVFGGVYMLRRTAAAAVKSDGRCQAIIDNEGKRIGCGALIAEASYAGALCNKESSVKRISRAILLTDRSLAPDSEEHVCLLRWPGDAGRPAVTLIELSPNCHVCPPGLVMVHLVKEDGGDPAADFAALLAALFCDVTTQGDVTRAGDGRPRVLWSVMFSVTDSGGRELNTHGLENVHVTAGPDAKLDMSSQIEQAREIFQKMCPDEEFLPAPPDPEDIIWGE